MSGEIIFQELNPPDHNAAQLNYGLEFVDVTEKQIQDFHSICDRLVTTAHEIGERVQERPAIAFIPRVVLVDLLTDEQIRAINERETPSIAEYCVEIQTALRNVPIRESFEPMRFLPDLFESERVTAAFSDIPYPDTAGAWAGKPQEFWVRHSMAIRLLHMGKILGHLGVQLHFIEAFRPEEVQTAMYRRRLARTRIEFPSWSEEQITAESQSKTASCPRLASHMGGAAVDLLLAHENGELLDFGHSYPDSGAIVFTRTPYLTASQWRNRQLLQVAAGLSDLTLYTGEDWHLSYGDNLASRDVCNNVRPGYFAPYGPIRNFDRTTGRITDAYLADAIDQSFVLPKEYLD